MIIDSNNKSQRSILTNKCFYQTTARIMRDFEEKGYANSADETAKVIAAYHDLVKKKTKNNFNADYNAAFQRIDNAIQTLANKVFYDCDKKAQDYAYHSFEEFDHINAIVGRQHVKKRFAVTAGKFYLSAGFPAGLIRAKNARILSGVFLSRADITHELLQLSI